MNLRKVLSALVAVVAIVIIYFAARNWLLKKLFDSEAKHLSTVYGLQLTTKEIYFSDISEVHLSGLSLINDKPDTLVNASEIKFHLSLTKLLTGSISVNSLQISDVFISVNREPEHDNLAFLNLLKKGQHLTEIKDSYKEDALIRQNELFRLLNIAFKAKRVSLIYSDSSGVNTFFAQEVQYDLKKLSAIIINSPLKDTIIIRGIVLQKNSEYQFDLKHTGADIAWLPFLNHSPGLKCGFQAVSGSVKFSNSGDVCMLHIRLQAQKLRLNHWRLGKEDVMLPEVQLNSLLKITDSALEIDSTSNLKLAGASFGLFGHYQRAPDTMFALSIHMPEIPSDTFFNALPLGMFNTLKGISCSGTLAYDLQFSMHTNQPDSLIFLSSFKRKDFHIIHYGADNLGRINVPFIYQAYQGTKLLRQINVGPENPTYAPLNKISHYLPLCIMQSEDPGFMEHRGFIPEAMRESIAQDYREKRFARGGSTISMQLVKNVFLKRDKTISRKLEEALIVYLIENLQLVSKERMMEVYLNVIEWGPGVYGVGEASDFYFGKKPAQLTLPECVFLAAIIPNPRSFRYQFDKSGRVKPYITDFYRLITGRLVNRNLIDERDTIGISPGIKLHGPASLLVIPGDTLNNLEEEWSPDLE